MVCKRSPSSYIRAGVTRILWIWRHDAKEGSQLVYIPQLLFRVKKEWLDTRKDIPDWSRVRIASFFTRCISPGSSATPCLIWLRWRLGTLHTDSYAGIPTNHNYLNISIIRKMLANSYIISKTKVSQLLYSILYKKRQEIPDVIIIRKVPDCFQDGRVWWFVHFHQPISTGSHSQYDIQAYLYNCRTKDVAGIFQGPYLFQTDA